MAVPYKTYKKRNGINAKELYYAHAVTTGRLKMDDIGQDVSHRSSLTKGDFASAFQNGLEIIIERLSVGFSVDLDQYLTFKLSATSEGYETPEECTPDRVSVNRLCITAGPKLKALLRDIEFRRM